MAPFNFITACETIAQVLSEVIEVVGLGGQAFYTQIVPANCCYCSSVWYFARDSYADRALENWKVFRERYVYPLACESYMDQVLQFKDKGAKY